MLCFVSIYYFYYLTEISEGNLETNDLNYQVQAITNKFPVKIVENYVDLSSVAQKSNHKSVTDITKNTELHSNAITEIINNTVSSKDFSKMEATTTSNSIEINASLNTNNVTTAAANDGTVKLNLSKTTKFSQNHFPLIEGMYNMSKFLKLPPPVPIRDASKEPLLNYPQQRDYPQLHKCPNKCGRGHKFPVDFEEINSFNYDSEIFLLMAVKSSCTSKDRRDAVRQTWGNESWVKQNLNVNSKLVFLLGRCTNDSLSKSLEKENEEWMDILQWDFHDSFGNLTLKEVLFLQWFTKTCQNVPYVFKGKFTLSKNSCFIYKFY